MRPAITFLLLLYPSQFRHAFGRLIELQVRDELRSSRGPFTATRIVADMIRGAAAEHVSAYRTAPFAQKECWCEVRRSLPRLVGDAAGGSAQPSIACHRTTPHRAADLVLADRPWT
jgi:hypothetical protein